MRLAVLLLAAGASARMRGGDKLLEMVGGLPLIARQAARAVATGCPVLVTLPVPEGARGGALDGLAVTRVPVPDAGDGMAASVRAGVAALPGGLDGLMLMPADMPEITTEDMERMGASFADAGGTRALRGASGGKAGHPVIFPARLFPELLRLEGDSGAKPVLAREGYGLVELPGAHALTDLDTPEDWAAWRARQGDETERPD